MFGDATYEFNPQWELDAAIRYDEDRRQNTTDTPQAFLNLVPGLTAVTGEVREHTFFAELHLTTPTGPQAPWSDRQAGS